MACAVCLSIVVDVGEGGLLAADRIPPSQWLGQLRALCLHLLVLFPNRGCQPRLGASFGVGCCRAQRRSNCSTHTHIHELDAFSAFCALCVFVSSRRYFDIVSGSGPQGQSCVPLVRPDLCHRRGTSRDIPPDACSVVSPPGHEEESPHVAHRPTVSLVAIHRSVELWLPTGSQTCSKFLSS